MDNVEVDFDKLLKYSEELVDYEDVLPLLIRAVIMKKWSDNLNRKGLLVDIRKKCVENKPHNYNEAVQELEKWVKDNPKYKDILIKGR